MPSCSVTSSRAGGAASVADRASDAVVAYAARAERGTDATVTGVACHDRAVGWQQVGAAAASAVRVAVLVVWLLLGPISMLVGVLWPELSGGAFSWFVSGLITVFGAALWLVAGRPSPPGRAPSDPPPQQHPMGRQPVAEGPLARAFPRAVDGDAVADADVEAGEADTAGA